MKIAITTFFQSQTNYGQLLQAFSLQQILMQMGHFPYIIRYGFHKTLSPILGMEAIETNFEKLLDNVQWEETQQGSADDRQFDSFRKVHLNLSHNAYNHLEELQLFPPIADCYLTGSDQVWAQLLSCTDNQTFFLNFGPKEILRISYAPSFALKSYPSELNSILMQHLNRFDAISVREKTGVDICKNVGTSALWVVDPTMLLDGDYYRRLAKESQVELPDNYMFVYHVNVNREDFPFWIVFSNYNAQQGIKAVAVHANGENQPDVEFLEDARYLYPSIQEWIRLIDSSKYVLTTSFHGMIFAILLHKPFFVGMRPESMFAGNDRIVTVLSELGLLDRIVTSETNLHEVFQTSIDWDTVDRKLETLRVASLSFLEKHLKDCCEPLTLQQWKQYSSNKIQEFISSKKSEKETYECRILQLRQQIMSQQQKVVNLQNERESLISEINRLVLKKKKYLVIGRWLIILLILSFLILILSFLH